MRTKKSATLLACAFIFALPGVAQQSAQALTFNVTLDASTSAAPAGFFTAFNDAINFYQTKFNDPITINLHVGWGELDGNSLNVGELGQSKYVQQINFNYAQIKSALTSDATSAADATAIASLPANDPTGGAEFVLSNPEAKALGLLAGNASAIDGYVGFSSTAAFTFDPNNRAVAGENDFISTAEHEISEVMGRYGMGQNGTSGRYSPLDLFRYTAPGVLDLAPENGAYFSIDGGNTVINTFNGTGGGDLSDWVGGAGETIDAYNAHGDIGNQRLVSAGDLIEMDILGYDAVPEPNTLILLGTGFGSVLAARRRGTRSIRRECDA